MAVQPNPSDSVLPKLAEVEAKVGRPQDKIVENQQRHKHAQVEEKIKELAQSLYDAHRNNKELERENKELYEQLNDAKKRITEMEKINKKLSQNLDDGKNERKELEVINGDLERKVKELNDREKQSKSLTEEKPAPSQDMLRKMQQKCMDLGNKHKEKATVGGSESMLENRNKEHTSAAAANQKVDDTDRVQQLITAVCNGNIAEVKSAIASGVDVNTPDGSGSTALHLAADRGHLGICELLLDAGADVDVRSYWLDTPLHLAGRHTSVVKLLISRGASVSPCNFINMTPLHNAAGDGYVEICEVLLDNNAHVYARASRGETPLLLACRFRKYDVVKLLIARGVSASVSYSDNTNRALHWAAAEGCVEICDLLVKNGEVVDALGYEGETPLHRACHYGILSVVKLLISRNASVSVYNSVNNTTPLHYAAQRGSVEICQFLLDNNADVNATDCSGKTPLHAACDRGRLAVVELLISRGASVSACTSDNNTTPLHYAAKRGDVEICKLLLENNADVNAIGDYRSESPLHAACGGGELAVVKLLISRGAFISACNSGNRTPLHKAVGAGHTEICHFLLDNNADVNATDSQGQTPLHAACAGGTFPLVKLLISRGASSKIQDHDGHTPLYYTYRNYDKSIYNYLKTAGH